MTNDDRTHWGRLRGRYERPHPRRLLALEGGGIRGLLTLRVLKRLETLLAEHYFPDSPDGQTGFRLCQFFDYIGGTSTGSIIAAGLARGMSIAQIEAFYNLFGKEAFAKRSFFQRWKSFYEDGPLVTRLRKVFSSNDELETLEPRFLKTLLLVVTKKSDH
jgi:patatin-like phospholipase/acyl hydrolase